MLELCSIKTIIWWMLAIFRSYSLIALLLGYSQNFFVCYLLVFYLWFVHDLSRWNYQVAQVFGQFTTRVLVEIQLTIMNIMLI